MHLTDAFIFKWLTLHYSLSVPAFPGNQTHYLCIASALLYCLSYKKSKITFALNFHPKTYIAFKEYIWWTLASRESNPWLKSKKALNLDLKIDSDLFLVHLIGLQSSSYITHLYNCYCSNGWDECIIVGQLIIGSDPPKVKWGKHILRWTDSPCSVTCQII